MATITYSQLEQQITTVKYLINMFTEDITNKELTVFLGNTKSGKSTLINYLIGNKLESCKKDKRYCIRIKSPSCNGPVIEHSSVSCTSFPEVWINNTDPDVHLVDMPGFDDNRGPVKNIINTLFANQLKFSLAVKFVLVCDIMDILCDNVRNFTSAITKIEQVLPAFQDIRGSLSVIFTKDNSMLTNENIARMLYRKIVTVPGIQIRRNFIYHISKHPELIGIFRMPKRNGNVAKEEVDCNIERAILNSQAIINKTTGLNFILPEDSHCFLLGIYQNSLAKIDFNKEVRKMVSRYWRYFTVEKYVFASTENELCQTKTHLQYIEAKLSSEKVKAFTNMDILIESLSSVAGGINGDLENNLRFFKYMEENTILDEKIRESAVKSYVHALGELKSDVNRLMNKITSEQQSRTQETLQYVLSELARDKKKFTIMCVSLLPGLKKALEALGVQIQFLEFEIAEIGAVGWGFVAASIVGAAAGAYVFHYYNTVVRRNKFRKEQGR